MARKGRMASLRKADSGDVTAYFNISDFMVPKEGGRMSPDMQDDAISFLQDAVEKSMSELSRIVKSNLKKSKDIDDAGLKLK